VSKEQTKEQKKTKDKHKKLTPQFFCRSCPAQDKVRMRAIQRSKCYNQACEEWGVKNWSDVKDIKEQYKLKMRTIELCAQSNCSTHSEDVRLCEYIERIPSKIETAAAPVSLVPLKR